MFFPSAIDLVGRVAVALADRAEANYTNHVQIDDSGGGHSGAAGIHTMLARIVVGRSRRSTSPFTLVV